MIFEQDFRENPDKTGFSVSVCFQKSNRSPIEATDFSRHVEKLTIDLTP